MSERNGGPTMKVHNYGQFPPDYDYNYGDIGGLSEWDIEKLESLGIDEVWYWYAYGSYEGSGQILMRKGDEWDVHNAGHCSCFGPTDEVAFTGHESLDALVESLSGEYYRNEVEPLIGMARAGERG